MKNICTAALLLLSGLTLYSGQQQDLNRLKVNYYAEKISAIDAIERFLAENRIKQFAYSSDHLKNYRIQAVKCTDETVLVCLGKILKGLPLDAVIYNNTVIIRQKIQNTSSTSNLENPQALAIDQKKQDTIKLTDRESKIEEITLNAGYYSVKDKERTGSISKVTAKDIENQPITNVLSAAQGRMAGVSITQNSGTPGGGFDIQIRGKNSLRTSSNSGIDGSQPLYVIDGVPIGGEMTSPYSNVILPGASINPLNSINPNDIESFEILKDADATAIYGSRGANGVILVTTKKGKTGRLTLNFNTSYALNQVASKMKMMDTSQYLNMRKQAFANDGISVYPATAYDINGTWDQGRYTDWVKTLIGNTATSSNTQLSISGGIEKTTFLLGFGHNEQTTAFANGFKYKSTNLSTNISHSSANKKFQLSTSNIFSVQKNNIVRSDITRQAYWLTPNSPALYTENGALNWENNTFTNPIAPYNSTYSNESKQFLTNINTAYELFEGFKIKLNSGINYQALDEIAIQPNTMYNPSFALGQSSATSRSSQSRQNRFSFIMEPQLDWIYKNGSHEVDVLLGGTFQREMNQQGSMTGIGFESNQFIENIGAAQTKTVSDQVDNEYRYAAFFGRINYQFRNRYILNITGRRDGSSRFGPNKKFANFGAVGVAWIFSGESFLKDVSWLSFGKLRSSFGSAGSDNIGDYQYLDTYTVSSSIYNTTTGLLPSRLYNPDYSWEKTVKLEAAMELGFFRNRLNMTMAWYRNRSSNQLIGIQLPSITGFTSVLANLPATVQNTGVELEITAGLIKSRTFQWSTSFNISFPKNKLVSFPGMEGSTYANQFVIGQPTSIIKVYQLQGINPKTGMYEFTDFNGDGKISSPDDNKIIEKIGVQYFGGWNNTISYKNWDFSFLFQFVKQRNRNYNNIMPIPGSMNNQPIEVLDVWSAENPNGTYAPYRAGANTSHNLFQNSTAAVSDASFVRLKNLQIGYKVPLTNGMIKNIKVYFQGQNLLTFTNYFGIDPEFTAMGFLPPLRTFSFGTQFNF